MMLRIVNIVVDRIAIAVSILRSTYFGWTEKFICSSVQSFPVADAVELCIGACDVIRILTICSTTNQVKVTLY